MLICVNLVLILFCLNSYILFCLVLNGIFCFVLVRCDLVIYSIGEFGGWLETEDATGAHTTTNQKSTNKPQIQITK